MAPNLAAPLELQARFPDPEPVAFLGLTLDAMAEQGLRDRPLGGFFRLIKKLPRPKDGERVRAL